MGAVLWPVGEASNGYLAIGMDECGRCGVFMERVYLATETFDELVIALVRGVRTGTEWAGG